MNKTKQYHYFYKITNLINGHFYYGVHNTNNLDDGYMGSGTRLNHAYKIYGIENFKKEIIKFFDSTEEAFEYEAFIVNEELVKNHECYNIQEGGKSWVDGRGTKNTISIIDTKTGERFRCNIDDPNYLNGRYVGVSTGHTIGFDKTGKSYYVSKNDNRFITGELIHYRQNTGRIIKDGKILFVDKNSNDYKIYPKYDIMKDKITVRSKDNKTFVVNKDDPRYLSGELQYFWKGMKHSEETKRKIGLKNKIHQSGSNNSNYGKIWIYNENEKISKSIKKDELDNYIQLGWKKGRKIKF